MKQRMEAAEEASKPYAHSCEALAHARPSPFYPLSIDRQTKGTDRSFFRRPLAPGLISFTSTESKQLLKDVLLETGSSSSFYDIMHAFDVQSDPASCGLASLAISLNALGVSFPHRFRTGSPDSARRAGEHSPVTEEDILCFVKEADRARVRAGVGLEELAGFAAMVPGAHARVVHGSAADAGGGGDAFAASLRVALAATARWSAPGAAAVPGAVDAPLVGSGRGVVLLNFSRSLYRPPPPPPPPLPLHHHISPFLAPSLPYTLPSLHHVIAFPPSYRPLQHSPSFPFLPSLPSLLPSLPSLPFLPFPPFPPFPPFSSLPPQH